MLVVAETKEFMASSKKIISFFFFFLTFSPLTIYFLFKNNILAFNVLHNMYTNLIYYIKY